MRIIAVDAMGGDEAPAPEVEGAVMAVREQIANVILVGNEPLIRERLAALGGAPPGLRVMHTTEVIQMDDHPAQAARTKRDSSMRVGFDLVRKGGAHAVVSAGNSGAMMACGLFVFGRLSGVERPGVITTFPTKSGVCALVDMGANVDCKPQTLAQFGVLGAAFAGLYHSKRRPRVGVLSNGTEVHKGTELTRATARLLEASDIIKDFDYVGYVEGRDIFEGKTDVAVTDGFTGNVVLKAAEGVVALIVDRLKREVFGGLRGKIGGLILRSALRRLAQQLDYAEHGGAPLVGVDGVAVLCHGRSNAKAMKNGIRAAARLSEGDLVAAAESAIARHAPLWSPELVQAVGG
jgi:glycerol-3-phosphate acyltransferase PlsX